MIRASGADGLTNDQISEQYNKTGSMFSPRLIELEREGHIVKLMQTRKTRSGRQANIYITPDFINDRQIVPVKGEEEKLTPEIFQFIYNSWARENRIPQISIGDAGDLLVKFQHQGYLK